MVRRRRGQRHDGRVAMLTGVLTGALTGAPSGT
jgi:hypothetical protein